MRMFYGSICEAVEKVKRQYAETDPFQLCKDMGISVLYKDMGKDADSCKGFFLPQSRIRCIVINNNLSYELQRVICSHELGHAVLHRNIAGVRDFHDFNMFNLNSERENEANIFAAELLLKDEDVYTTLNEDTTFFQAALDMRVPFELLDFKFRVMKWKGYKIGVFPVYTQSNWLKNAVDGGEDF
jgi:Zn-dependent peptidase ImmA (M78 family)